jgi:P27 family predicted phage terminase small subunit
MKGRKQLPQSVKKLKGTAKPCRTNQEAPDPSVVLPEAPGWLTGELEHVAFDILLGRISDMNVASATDTEMLAMAAKRLAEVWECDAVIQSMGRVIAVGEGWRSNPAVGQKNEAMRHLHALLGEFGLSPATRQKVSTITPAMTANRFAE